MRHGAMNPSVTGFIIKTASYPLTVIQSRTQRNVLYINMPC